MDEYDPVLLGYMAALQSMCDHDKCAPDWAEMIFTDAAEYWTEADAKWLALKTDLIAARRELQALQKPGRLVRFLNWVRYWL